MRALHDWENDHDIFAFFKDPVSTTPADVRIKCMPSAATQEASDFRWGCTDSQIFFFCICAHIIYGYIRRGHGGEDLSKKYKIIRTGSYLYIFF